MPDVIHRPTAFLPEGAASRETCRECDEEWPCRPKLLEVVNELVHFDVVTSNEPMRADERKRAYHRRAVLRQLDLNPTRRPCPKCSVKGGYFCVDFDGEPVLWVHDERHVTGERDVPPSV